MADPHVVPRVSQAIERNVALLYGRESRAGAGALTAAWPIGVPDALNLYEGDAAIAEAPYLVPAFPEPDPMTEGDREIFTIGEKGLASPARLAQLVAHLGVAYVVDVRMPPPRRGKWTTTELEELLEKRLVTPQAGSDVCAVIASLSPGRILVLSGAKSPADAPVRLAIGDEHPEWEVIHIYHDQPADSFAEAQCIAHAELSRAMAADSGYEFTTLIDHFVEDAEHSGKYSFTALTFPTCDDRDAAADLFSWNQSPWQDGFAFMTEFHAFLAYRVLHPDRSPEERACGAARLILELVDPARPDGPCVTDPSVRINVMGYLQQALAQLEKSEAKNAESVDVRPSPVQAAK